MRAVLQRVRWGNVARLAALLAAGVLIALGGRDRGGEPARPEAVRAPRGEAPAQPPRVGEGGRTKPSPTERRRPAKRGRKEGGKPMAPERPSPRQKQPPPPRNIEAPPSPPAPPPPP